MENQFISRDEFAALLKRVDGIERQLQLQNMKNQFSSFDPSLSPAGEPIKKIPHKKSSVSERKNSYNEQAQKSFQHSATLQTAPNQRINSFCLPNGLKVENRISDNVKICKTKEENLMVISVN